MLRVVHLTDRFVPAIGGVESHVFNLCRKLAEQALDVSVVTSDVYTVNPLAYLIRKGTADNIRVITKKGLRLLPLPQGLGLISPGMITELNGDIIHAHGLGRFPTFLWWIARSKRIPFVVTTHSDAGRGSLAKRLFDSIIPEVTIKHADRVIALTKHEKDYLIRLGVERSKISVIPNGIDLKELSRFRMKARRLPDTIVFAGRIDVQHKGLDVLVQALAILIKDRNRKLKLYLAGPEEGSGYNEIKRLSKRLQIDGNVYILGPLKRSSLLQLISDASILVLPSRIEPFGIVLLEAMALGTPIVASAVGGIPEILGEGRFGLLVPPADANMLAEAIDELLTNESKVRSLTTAALEEVKRYDWSLISKTMISLYKSLLRDN